MAIQLALLIRESKSKSFPVRFNNQSFQFEAHPRVLFYGRQGNDSKDWLVALNKKLNRTCYYYGITLTWRLFKKAELIAEQERPLIDKPLN